MLRMFYLADVFLHRAGSGAPFPAAGSEIVREGRGQGEEQPAAKRSGEGPACRVLVVYDDPVQLKLLKLQLDMVGYEVATAVDGFDAYDRARRFMPHAIVSDIMMPGLDGFGLCQIIRGDSRLSHIPVILVTAAQISPDDRNKADSAGASALFLSRPGFAEVKQALATNLG